MLYQNIFYLKKDVFHALIIQNCKNTIIFRDRTIPLSFSFFGVGMELCDFLHCVTSSATDEKYYKQVWYRVPSFPTVNHNRINNQLNVKKQKNDVYFRNDLGHSSKYQE